MTGLIEEETSSDDSSVPFTGHKKTQYEPKKKTSASSRSGNPETVLFIPHTPDSTLKKAMMAVDKMHAQLTMGVKVGSGEAFDAHTKSTKLHNSVKETMAKIL